MNTDYQSEERGEAMAALNIKNEEAYRLVRELADLRGESMTQVVIEIAREAIQREKPDTTDGDRIQRWLEIGADNRRRMKEPFLSSGHGDLLYDEKGLPK
ncbi:MAG: type II toxin-antitoxin system VapB family antitoxin [Thermomicrobiales bacterium]